MELPSSRELELETLLRERDSQVSELKDEIGSLRQYLSKQPGPSKADPITVPPAVMSILLPYLKDPSIAPAGHSTSTVTAALTQRARLLQEENDELYELLKSSETGKLKDEVRGLRRVVARLEGALQESHQIIRSLQTELDKTYETLMSSSRLISNNTNTINTNTSAKSHSRSPRNSYHPPSSHHNDYPSNNGGSGSGSQSQSKLPPTGPRAHKKPRLSEPQPSPPPRAPPQLPHKPQNSNNINNNLNLPSRPDSSHVRGRERERDRDQPQPQQSRHANSTSSSDNRPIKSLPNKMDVEEDYVKRSSTPPVTRERDRVRERDRNKERQRDRERGRESNWEGGNRQGGGGGGGGAARRNGNYNNGNNGPSNSRSGGGGGHSTRIKGAAGGGHHSSGGGGGGGQLGGGHAHGTDSSGRTLQERMGL